MTGFAILAARACCVSFPVLGWPLLQENTMPALRFASCAALILHRKHNARAHRVGAEPVLKFSHFLGPQSFFQRDVAEPWAKRLEERSAGKVKVEVFNAGSPHGDVRKQASQVKDGTVDIALGLRGAEGERFPGSSVIELPFLVRDSESGSKALWDLYQSGAARRRVPGLQGACALRARSRADPHERRSGW